MPMSERRFERRASGLSAGTVALMMASKAVAASAPAVGMFGSFFPAWLLCLVAGVIATVVIRFGFIVVGLDDILRWRVLVYMSMAAGLTFLMTYVFFGR